jgi:hypothetical protein
MVDKDASTIIIRKSAGQHKAVYTAETKFAIQNKPGSLDDVIVGRHATCLPTRFIQGFQAMMQNRVLAPALASAQTTIQVPTLFRLLVRMPILRDLPSRLIGFGVKRVQLDGKREFTSTRQEYRAGSWHRPYIFVRKWKQWLSSAVVMPGRRKALVLWSREKRSWAGRGSWHAAQRCRRHNVATRAATIPGRT